MFDPKMIPEYRKKFNTLIDVSSISVNLTQKDEIYANYFLILEKIKALLSMNNELKILIEEIKPYITHTNTDLRDVLYSCYSKLKDLNESIPAEIEQLENKKILVIENFNNIYQTVESV